MPALSLGSGAINFATQGEGDWLVLLHEIGGTLETWSAVTPPLAQHFKVLRYDQRGSGQSAKISGPFKLDNQIDDLAALLDKLGVQSRCHLAGVALGAALAARFAVTFPQRVASLVLACPAPGVNADRIKYLEERAAQVARDGMGATVENSLSNSYPDVVRRDAALFATYRVRFLANDPQSYAAINRAFAHFNVTPDLPNIGCPTLVLAGTHDRLRPPDFVKAVAAAIPHAQYREIDSGHVMPVQAPADMVREMLGFYARQGIVQ